MNFLQYLFDCLYVVLTFLLFIFKKLQIISKSLTQGQMYHNLRKTFWKLFRSYSKLLSKFGKYIVSRICFKLNYSPRLWRWSQSKIGQFTANFISSSLKIVKLYRRPQYDPVIIGRTISLLVVPSKPFTVRAWSIAHHG